jgi:pimeloyl-ACP methyl ester carboxylesterase
LADHDRRRADLRNNRDLVFLGRHQRGHASAHIYKVNLRSCPVSLREPLRHDSAFDTFLVPGLVCTEDLFAEQIASLRGEVAISVADHARHDTMSAIARAVLATAPNRFALCGLSMGGYIAFEMVRQAPDRIERLALLDTSALSGTPEQTQRRLKLLTFDIRRATRLASRKLRREFCDAACV